MISNDFFKGRGAQINIKNKFLKREYVCEFPEALDEPLLSNSKTEFFKESPKNIVNKIASPDLGLTFSVNPYQGCEHGCIYCYARNTHEYWGYSAGLDFERKIIIKENAPLLLKKSFENPNWHASPIMLSGNTDCYQPIEKEKEITRRLLEVFLKYNNPVGLITKNSLILRDIDILQELAKRKLVHVNISITTLNEELRQKLEPRTTTSLQRLKTVEVLSSKGIPVNIMIAPIIPSLNSHEIPEIMKLSSEKGALSALYTIVRLNGAIQTIFEDWVNRSFPEKAFKILNQIKECHNGKLNDSRFGLRMTGDGAIAEAIKSLFTIAKNKYFKDKEMPPYDLDRFIRPPKNGQLSLF